MHREKSELGRFKRELKKEDQLVFDELWYYVSKHLAARNQAVSNGKTSFDLAECWIRLNILLQFVYG